MRRIRKRTVRKCRCAECRRRPQSVTAREHRALNRVVATLNEKHRRRLAGMLAVQWGWGGVTRLHLITGLSRNTIEHGRREVKRVEQRSERQRVRKKGAVGARRKQHSRAF